MNLKQPGESCRIKFGTDHCGTTVMNSFQGENRNGTRVCVMYSSALLFFTVAVQTERTVIFQDTCKWVLSTFLQNKHPCTRKESTILSCCYIELVHFAYKYIVALSTVLHAVL